MKLLEQKICRICSALSPLFVHHDRYFFKCPDCRLIFTEEILPPAEEEVHYKNQWGEADPTVWKNKAELILKVACNYRVPNRILDFGSGSGDLTCELQKLGLEVTPLEPMIHGYLKDQRYLKKFDVVVAIEVIEHLLDPWQELREIEKVLADDGIMIFSTLFTNPFVDQPDEVEQFRSWWYKDDPTHVSFFCNQVFSKMADMGNYNIDIFGNQLFVVQRIPESNPVSIANPQKVSGRR
jgi:SAM-dependent methyltransferase